MRDTVSRRSARFRFAFSVNNRRRFCFQLDMPTSDNDITAIVEALEVQNMNGGSDGFRTELAPVSAGIAASVRKVERKGRKPKERGKIWRDVVSEIMESALTDADENFGYFEDLDEPDSTSSPEGDKPSDDFTGVGVFDGSKREFECMIGKIRKMSENPEELVESHLSIFTDPVPPGKVLNSRG